MKSVQNYVMMMVSDGFDECMSLSTNLLRYYVDQTFTYPKLLNLFNILQQKKYWDIVLLKINKIGQMTSKVVLELFYI